LRNLRVQAFLPVLFSFCLLLSGSCSFLGPAFTQPSPDQLVQAEKEAAEREIDNAPVTPKSIDERYPYIRFFRQTDGMLRAIVPAPLGAGGNAPFKGTEDVAAVAGTGMAGMLYQNVPCLSRAETPAFITVEKGSAHVGNPAATPAQATGGSSKPVEDLLMIVGTEDDIHECLSFIDLYYNSAPQVEIQAQIMEVTDTDAFERGIEELVIQNLKDGNPFVYPRLDGNGNPILDPNTGLYSDPTGVGVPGPFLRGFNTDFPYPSIGGGFELSIINDSYILDAFLKMVRTLEGADLVSRPRIVTRNGLAAQLSSQEEIPYQTFKNVNTNGNSTISVGHLKVGVDLKVLPIIVGADTIHLTIDARVSRAGRNVALGSDVFMPVTTNRSANTAVAVRSGQSVVIGGLVIDEERYLESKVPLLGSIPILGWLFSYKNTEKVKTEVFFVITPQIKTRNTSSIEAFGDIFDPFNEGTGTE
jgi:type II secretory pathway component GspD/PulD (secretin)